MEKQLTFTLYYALSRMLPGIDMTKIRQLYVYLVLQHTLKGDIKIQVAATATVCSRLQKVAILFCQLKPS